MVDDNVDAAQSLARAQGAWPEVFILDIGLPDADGYALARRLRADMAMRMGGGGATLVALTGYGQAHHRVLAKTAGFDHYFVEPVELAPLVEIIGRAPVGDAPWSNPA